MKGFVCQMCSFVSIDGTVPEKCPQCGAPKSAFQEEDDALKEAKDEKNLTDLEKKHSPVIMVVKKCDLIPEGCTDVHTKTGTVPHPMLPEHSIMYIDFYINRKFISRIKFTPEIMNAAASLHLRVDTGKFTAVARCNIHGAWIKETEM